MKRKRCEEQKGSGKKKKKGDENTNEMRCEQRNITPRTKSWVVSSLLVPMGNSIPTFVAVDSGRERGFS